LKPTSIEVGLKFDLYFVWLLFNRILMSSEQWQVLIVLSAVRRFHYLVILVVT